MIHYVVRREHTYTLGPYLALASDAVRRQIRILPYEDLEATRRFAAGPTCFPTSSASLPERQRWPRQCGMR